MNCHRCGAFMEFEQRIDDPNTVVRCRGCGKKHSTDSVHMVDINKEYERNEEGVLVDNRIA